MYFSLIRNRFVVNEIFAKLGWRLFSSAIQEIRTDNRNTSREHCSVECANPVEMSKASRVDLFCRFKNVVDSS